MTEDKQIVAVFSHSAAEAAGKLHLYEGWARVNGVDLTKLVKLRPHSKHKHLANVSFEELTFEATVSREFFAPVVLTQRLEDYL